MLSAQDFEYAMESTRVVIAPERIIETFGSTSFRFVLVTEFMDATNQVRVRGGSIEAERPRIVAPQHFQKMLLDGFGERARDFADWLEQHGNLVKVLRYGFSLKKTDIYEHTISQSLESAVERLQGELKKEDDSSTALITGIEDGWEVCLLKFTSDLIRKSSSENVNEWQRRGLL